MPSLSNGVSPHQHLLQDITGIDTVAGVQSFTFAPQTTTNGQSYGTWAELYAAYTAARTAVPYAFREIVFDPRGLAAGEDVEISPIAGVPIQTFESQTVFTSKGNPTGPSGRISVKVSSAVVFQVLSDLSDPGLGCILSIQGLDFFQEAGAAAPLLSVPAPLKLKLVMLNASMRQHSAGVSMLQTEDGDLEADLTDSEIPGETDATTGPVGSVGGAGNTLVLTTNGPCTLGGRIFASDLTLAEVQSYLSADTVAAPQPGIKLPAGVMALFAPAANANVRPAYSLTVLAKGQLKLAPPDNTPYVVQGFPFKISGNPAPGNTLNLGDGVVADTEAYTFVAVPAAPFEVEIGADAIVTMSNLVDSINSDSVLWGSQLIKIPGGGAVAVAIYRQSQSQEGLTSGLMDNAWGTFDPGVDPIVGVYPEPTTGFFLLSYSTPTFQALPTTEPTSSFAGWSTVSGLKDKSLVTVIDDFRSGAYQVFNPAAGGSGSWKFLADAADDPTIIAAAGTYLVGRQARLVVCTLGALDVVELDLSPFCEPGVPLMVHRTDNSVGTLTLVPVLPDTTINGAPSLSLPGGVNGTGLILTRNGAGGWVVTGLYP